MEQVREKVWFIGAPESSWAIVVELLDKEIAELDKQLKPENFSELTNKIKDLEYMRDSIAQVLK